MTQRALLIVVVWTLQAAKSKIEYTKISRHHKKSQDGLTILHRIWQMGGAWLSCKVHTRYTRLCWMAEAWPAIRKEFALSELKICATSLLDKPSRRFLKPQYVFPRQLIKMLKPWSSKPQSVGNPFQGQSHAPPNKPRQPLSNLFHSKAQTLHELSTRKAVLAFCFSHCLTGPAAKVVANSQTGHWSPKETQIHNHSNKSVPDPHLITPFALYTLIHHKPP